MEINYLNDGSDCEQAAKLIEDINARMCAKCPNFDSAEWHRRLSGEAQLLRMGADFWKERRAAFMRLRRFQTGVACFGIGSNAVFAVLDACLRNWTGLAYSVCLALVWFVLLTILRIIK